MAPYTIHFGNGTAVAETALKNGMRAWLDTPVRDAAVVYVNGVRAGATWAPPYRVALGKHLWPAGTPSGSRSRTSHQRDGEPSASRLPAAQSTLTARASEPQDLDHVRAMPSGLLGPITLTFD
jgi:hypothetical protein